MLKFRRFLHRAYFGGTGQNRWGLWRFTRAGLIVWILLFVSAAVGLDTRTTVVYKGFALLFCILFLAFVWSLFFRVRLTIKRVMPKFGTVGEPLEYRLIIRNESDQPERDLYLYDDTVDGRPTLEEFLYTPEPGEERRNAYDRTMLVYRWFWLTEMKRGAQLREHPLPTIPAHDERELRITITPIRRGYLRFEQITINRPDPLNLYRAFVRIALPHALLILPKRYVLPPMTLPGQRRFKTGGEALAASVGDSEEFVALRDYRPGDPLRHIHWKSWAKTEKPIVKEFQSEFFVRHALVLDTFQQAEFTAVFEEAIALAASFACTVRTQESLLDLMFVGPEAYCFTAGRGLGHTEQMLEILAAVKPCRDKPFRALPPLILERAGWLSGCICILLDWDDERQQFMQAIQAHGVPVLVFVITDQQTATLDRGPLESVSGNFYHLRAGAIQDGLQHMN